MIAPDTYRKVPAAQLVPSAESALALVRGEPGAAWAVLAHTLTRAVVMAPAGIAAGAALKVRPLASVAIVLAAAVGIEIGVLALAYRQVRDERRAEADDQAAEPTAEAAKAAQAASATLSFESNATMIRSQDIATGRTVGIAG